MTDKLYIANCTKQDIDLQYRVLEVAGVRRQMIPAGRQVEIAGPLNKLQIESIIEQHAPYGLVSADEARKSKCFVGMCYSLNKVVSLETMQIAFAINSGQLESQGARNRAEAAVAAHAAITQNLPKDAAGNSPMESLSMTVEQDRPGATRSGLDAEVTPISETVVVDPHSQGTVDTPIKTTGRQPRSRKKASA